MGNKNTYSSPQEIEEAEEQRRQEIDDSDKPEGSEEQEEEKPKSSEQEESEDPEQGAEGSEEGGEEEEGSEKDSVSSDLDDILSGHSSVGSEEEEGSEEDDPEEEEGGSYEPLDLELDNDDFEEITTDRESFQEFITQVRDDAVAQVREEFQTQLQEEVARAKEEVLQNIPEVVSKTAKRTQTVRSLKDQFFENNPQLESKMGYVRDMTNVVSTNNPDWGAKQVLDEVAKRANRDLNLSKQAEEREKKRKDPKFAGAGGRRSPGGEGDNRDKQAKLLDDTFGS